MTRSTFDRLISFAGALLAVVLLAAGGAGIYGGNFGLDNVRDRLQPQKIKFPPASAMTREEKNEVGDFADETVDTGPEAEAYSRFIGLHVAEVNDGKTYSETSAAARDEGLDPQEQAALRQKVDTLFRGETLRAILLNAYGWWTVAQIALYLGYGMLGAGVILAIFAALGFRHATKAALAATE